MMNVLRRIDRKTTREDALQMLRCCEYGFLSTVNADGTPHCVPMNFVLLGDSLYFHCARAGQKLDNLRRDARASFSCVARSTVVPERFTVDFASCMAEGALCEVADEAERGRAMRAMCQKYCAEFVDTAEYERTMRGMPATVVLRLDIAEVCGKALKGKL